MCQHIIQFCTGSAKPLLFAGGFLTLLLAISLGYTGCSSNALYQDIDAKVAQSNSLSYHLQLLAAVYLTLLTVFICFAAHYDQKHSIRVLAIITTVNFLLALIAILMIPSKPEIEKLIEPRLREARQLYDFEDKVSIIQTNSPIEIRNRTARMVLFNDQSNSNDTNQSEREPPLNKTLATQIWDKLQMRGCCGFKNYTEWKPSFPKSCCAGPSDLGGKFQCNEVDPAHRKPCLDLIDDSTNLYLLIVLALVALVNLYLTSVTGVSAYRTFSYNEASQSAYT